MSYKVKAALGTALFTAFMIVFCYCLTVAPIIGAMLVVIIGSTFVIVLFYKLLEILFKPY